MSETSGGGKVNLPAGVKIGAGRETSKLNSQGAVVAGMSWPITLNDGTQSSVFVPDTELHDTAKVTAIFDAKIKALQAVGG